MSKIFSEKYINCDGIAQIGWQKNVEKSLGVEGLIPTGYIMGYKSAADDLVEGCYNTTLIDTHVFPIVFLYRQYLELLLKNIYFRFDTTKQEEKADFIKKNGHKLSKVWNKVKLIMKNNNYKKKDSEFIEDFINEFEENDPNSFNFRYFANKDFTPTLPDEMYINLLKLKDTIDKVDDILYSTYN